MRHLHVIIRNNTVPSLLPPPTSHFDDPLEAFLRKLKFSLQNIPQSIFKYFQNSIYFQTTLYNQYTVHKQYFQYNQNRYKFKKKIVHKFTTLISEIFLKEASI